MEMAFTVSVQQDEMWFPFTRLERKQTKIPTNHQFSRFHSYFSHELLPHSFRFTSDCLIKAY